MLRPPRRRGCATQGEDFPPLLFLNLFLNISRKNQFEDSSHKRLNKKELGKKGKRKIKAHEAQPLNKSDMNLKSIVVRIVKESCNQAHCRNHQAYSCTDYGCFKKNRMCGFRVKVFADKFEGKRASVDAFHKIGKTEFNQNYRPDRHNAAEHIDSAVGIERAAVGRHIIREIAVLHNNRDIVLGLFRHGG